MKINSTKHYLMKICEAGAFKELPAITAYTLALKDQDVPGNEGRIFKCVSVDTFTGCTQITTNTIINNNNISDDPAVAGSFLFLTCPELAEGPLKTSFMKSFLHCLQIVVNLFTEVFNSFYKGLYKPDFFNNKYRPQELQLIPLNIQHTSTLPFNYMP